AGGALSGSPKTIAAMRPDAASTCGMRGRGDENPVRAQTGSTPRSIRSAHGTAGALPAADAPTAAASAVAPPRTNARLTPVLRRGAGSGSTPRAAAHRRPANAPAANRAWHTQVTQCYKADGASRPSKRLETNASPYSAATTINRNLYPVTSARYSRTPPTIAPSRFAPKATVAAPTVRKRCAKTRFARKIGANATAVAAKKRGTTGSERRLSCGTAHASASAPASAA